MRASSTRTDNRRERGANLVEFALVLPLLVLMLAGIADLGRAFRAYIAITNAAREGARFASKLPYDGSAIEDAVIFEAESDQVTLTRDEITISNLNGDGGEPITVTIEHQFGLILGGLIGLPGGSITLRNSSTMVIFGLEPE